MSCFLMIRGVSLCPNIGTLTLSPATGKELPFGEWAEFRQCCLSRRCNLLMILIWAHCISLSTWELVSEELCREVLFSLEGSHESQSLDEKGWSGSVSLKSQGSPLYSVLKTPWLDSGHPADVTSWQEGKVTWTSRRARCFKMLINVGAHNYICLVCKEIWICTSQLFYH